MLKLLLLGVQPPYPPRSGGQTRRWEMLKYLGARHRVSFVYLGDSDELSAPQAVQAVCERVVLVPRQITLSPDDRKLGGIAPMQVKPYALASMSQAIQSLDPHSFDLVLVDTVFMSMYRDLLPPQSVLLEQNVESQIYQRYARLNASTLDNSELLHANMTWRALTLYENHVWTQYPLRVVVSANDQRELQRRSPTGKSIVVPNGVDLEAFPLLPPNASHTLFFAGTLDYFPNPDAVMFLLRDILPRVRQSIPDVSLLVAGRNPRPEFAALADPPHIQIIGDPPDMQVFAEQASLSVVPLRVGGGTRLKILDALAWGLPIVTTSIGCEGLDLTDGQHVLIRDEPTAFADAIVELWSDPALYNALRRNGRALIERDYPWEPILERFEQELITFARTYGDATS